VDSKFDGSQREPREIDVATVRKSMHVSIIEGSFALQYMSLTTSTILVGFLLALGASASQIGLAAALPLLGGIFQPLGSELIRRMNGWRKGICVGGVVVDSALWLVTIAICIVLPPSSALIVALLVLALQQIAINPSALAWTSWVSDLIPPDVRGRFFSRRNFVIFGLGAITAVIAGQFIDRVGHNEIWSFLAAFAVGVVARSISAWFLTKQPEPFPAEHDSSSLISRMITPFRDPMYRKYLNFTVWWEFSFYLASPFFAVYMLQSLEVSFGTVAVFAGLTTVANLLTQRYWGRLSDRFGNQQVLRLTCLILTLEPLIWLFARNSGPGFVLIGVLHILGGAASGGMLLANANLMMGLAPLRDQTSFFAIRGATRGVFASAGPILGGVLLDQVFGPILSVPTFLGSGFALLFLIAFVFRSLGWFVLQTVREPIARPHMHPSVLLSEFARSPNLTQGFSPLLQAFFVTSDLDDDTIEEAIRKAQAGEERADSRHYAP